MGSLFPVAKQVAREPFGKANIDLRVLLATAAVCVASCILDFLPRMQSLSLQTTFMATHRHFLQVLGHSMHGSYTRLNTDISNHTRVRKFMLELGTATRTETVSEE